MDITSLLIFLAIGAVAGWLAGLLMPGGGSGLLGNIAVGIIGAVVGGFLLGLVGISAGSGLAGSLVTAVAGAAILLFIVGLVKEELMPRERPYALRTYRRIGRPRRKPDAAVITPGAAVTITEGACGRRGGICPWMLPLHRTQSGKGEHGRASRGVSLVKLSGQRPGFALQRADAAPAVYGTGRRRRPAANRLSGAFPVSS